MNNTGKNICMITAGCIVLVCWVSILYNYAKDNPNDFSGAIFLIFITGPIMSIILLALGRLIEGCFGE